MQTEELLNLSDEEFEKLDINDPKLTENLEKEPEPEDKKEEQQPPEEPNKEEPKSEPEGKTEEEPTEEKEEEDSEINYEDAYKQIMAPFKANGSTITLKTPQEAIALMQKGANYTSKMQQLAPQRKILKMLEKNNLMTEDDVELLIELKNKNPEAIKKFFKDSDIDPLDIDTSSEIKYKSGAQHISDKDMAFDNAVDNLKETEGGIDTIKEFVDSWDQKSKEILYEYPGTMMDIHEQRKSGVYKLISDEIARQKAIGQISQDVPFLVAYKTIKNNLDTSLAQNNQQEPVQVGAPLARGTNPSLGRAYNDARVRAAAPSRGSSSKKGVQYKNPFAMTDEEIENFRF